MSTPPVPTQKPRIFQLCLSNGTFVGCPTISFLEIFVCFLYMTIRCHSISVAHCGPTSSLIVKHSHPTFSAIGILLFPLRSRNPIHLHYPQLSSPFYRWQPLQALQGLPNALVRGVSSRPSWGLWLGRSELVYLVQSLSVCFCYMPEFDNDCCGTA